MLLDRRPRVSVSGASEQTDARDWPRPSHRSLSVCRPPRNDGGHMLSASRWVEHSRTQGTRAPHGEDRPPV
jgi:hypothetical protein